MKQLVTEAIVLSRTDYGEADRILTLLTPEQGKLSLVAKGVRRHKSKLAGGIELFSVTQITYMPGRSGSGLGTLVSSRLRTYYRHIVEDINRTMLGYELIKQLHRATEDQPDAEYFELLHQAFEALDDATINVDLIRLWFSAQLLRMDGHAPNLRTDTTGEALVATASYDFSLDDMTFALRPEGPYRADHIKLLRLIFNGGNQPKILQQVMDINTLTATVLPSVSSMLVTHIRI
jgi:DNA repair protein RecO (recombination protein O)